MSAIPILLGLLLAAPASSDEPVLEAARLPATDKALFDFFRKRAEPPPGRAAIEQLAHALGSESTTEADAAQRQLVSIGAPVVPVLREVANRVDAIRSSRRARQVLQLIEGPGADRLPTEAARLLAARKPLGAAEALLGYLPFADNDVVVEELVAALTAVGFRDGKADPAILAALKGTRAFGRATAARALCKAGGSSSWQAVRPLLADPEPSVRLQAALALGDAHDSQAIGVLIECLADGPPQLGARAEEYLRGLAGEWTVQGPRGNDLVSRELRRELWATWWKKTSGELLLRELQSRTLTDEELDRALALLRKLETEQGETAAAAARDLVALGPRVSPLLRRAVQQGHPRLSPAAARCLDGIEREFPPIPLPEALFRMLPLRRSAGTVPALLAFLPCAEDEEMVGRIERVLGSVGVVDGKADEVLVKALDDRAGIRRAAAAVALWQGRATAVLPSVRKVLADRDIDVRQRVARELASAGDREAVAALAGLLEVLPDERAWEVEEQLERLAGDKAPAAVAESPLDWKNVAGAWKQWWQGNRDKVAMTGSFAPAASGSLRGFTLLVQPQANTVLELGPDGKQRWALTGLQVPLDAQVLANQRVLVAEQNRVTERDLRGKVLWQKDAPQPRSVQRLGNGNTFITCTNLLLEVDRAGKEVLRVPVNGFGAIAARRLPDGRIVAFDRRTIIQFDKAGKEVKRAPVRTGGAGCNEVLDNGHVLSLSPMFGTLTEFDMDGKEVGSFAQPGASHGFRLTNGHTLVMTVVGNKYVELDRNFKPIKETALAAPAFRVKRR
jgi:HEAT repeat protein